VYNLITKSPQNDIWIEGGFVFAGDAEWVTVSSVLTTFINAAVFVSLPDIPGSTSSEGYPAIARIRNVVSTGQVSFEVKLYQANDSFCLKTWHVPQAIDPPLSLSWLAVERGAYELSGQTFMIGDGEISRAVKAPYDTSNRHTFMFPTGCVSASKSCEYPVGSDVGIITQLQTTVNERILITRVFSSNGISERDSVILVLQTHDSPDESYYVVSSPEQLAFMTFINDIQVSCKAGLSFETAKYDGVTHFKTDVEFKNTYILPPGLYGTIGTARSLADSTGLRAFSRTVQGSSFITQEDQCFDRETQHTTGELVYTFVVGELSNQSCTVCRALFTPETSQPTIIPTVLPTVCNASTSDPSYTDVFNLITKAPQTDVWIEGGFVFAGDAEWVTVSTIVTSFIDAAAFVSLPDISGETSDEGYPAIARIRNVVSTGQVSFDVKLYQANDSFCLKTWHVPQAIDPPLSLSWLVVERGAFNLTGQTFMIGDGEISRAVKAPYDTSNRHTFMFPTGCVSASKSCEYPAGSDVGIITQLQTTVNERILITRVFSSSGISQNNSVILVLQTHDSPDSTYYVVSSPEQLAFMTFINDIQVSCKAGLSFETAKYDGVTHFKTDVEFKNTYILPPGLYGTIGTARSLADSTGLRAFSRTVQGSSFITQEDQCFDRETQHTTGELVYTFVVGELSNQSCTVCRAVFSPETSQPTSLPTYALVSETPSLMPSTPRPSTTAPTGTCLDKVEIVRMSR
jgi:hypothetical protein